MHDVDRTQSFLEMPGLFEQGPGDGEDASSQLEDVLGESLDVMPLDEVLTDEVQFELATELLTLTNEREIDYFLGNLFRRVAGNIGKIAGPLKGVLKTVARKALPIAGGAIGGYFGGPLGAKLGSSLASGAGKIFGLEVEGLSAEDQSFEVARRFVRLAASAAKNAARYPVTADPRAAAKAAMVAAARKYAPGLLSAASGPADTGGQSGQWIRRGSRIVLLGV